MSRYEFSRRAITGAIGAFACCLSVPQAANAVARTWDANGASPANGTFNVAANWNPDGVPVAGDTVTFGTGGTYVVTFTADAASDHFSISNFSANLTLRSDSSTVRTYSPTSLGNQTGGTLTVGAAGLPMNLTVASSTILQAYLQPQPDPASLTLVGTGTSFTTGSLSIGSFCTVTVNQGTTLAANSTLLSGQLVVAGGQASLGTVAGDEPIFFSTGTLSYGGDLTVETGGLLGGNLNLQSTRLLSLTGTTTVTAGNTLTINATTFNTGALVNNGTINFTSGTLGITGAGGLVVGPGGSFGTNFAPIAGRTYNVTHTTLVETGSTFTLNGATFNTGSLLIRGQYTHNSGSLSTAADGAVMIEQSGKLIANASINEPIIGIGAASNITVNTSGVALGDATAFNGFNHQGVLNVGNGGFTTLTLNSAAYARLGALTSLNSATINAPNGVTLPSGSNLVGTGAVNARIAGEAGSIIQANGSLVLGDAASPAGFNFGGELRVGFSAVNLLSSQQVGLGNLTTMTGGFIFAPNGIVVDFNEAITGTGTVDSTDSLDKRTIINGLARGISPGQPLYIGGHVKGVGTFENVVFTGTFSPGLSPSVVTAGNIAIADGSTLLMELGGTSPGSGGHDQLQSSGNVSLNGTLAISLIDAFTPVAGSEFEILTFASRSGLFDDVTGDYLGQGLFLDPVYNSNNLTLVTNQAGAGDADLDGDVDLSDLSALAASYGANAPGIDWINGDFDHDNDVDLSDLSSLAANYGSGQAQAMADFQSLLAVPEPSGVAVCFLAGIAAVSGRKRGVFRRK